MSESLAIAEWRRAEDCRQVAQLCLRHRFYADTVSRSYYAVLHAARASLALYDVTVQNHRGLASMFGLHIVMSGLVEAHWSSVIGQLAQLRLAADYNIAVVFTEADAARAFDQADAFNSRIYTLLTDSIGAEQIQRQS